VFVIIAFASEKLICSPLLPACSLKPHVLVDVSEQDLSTTVLGHRISMPVMIAPTAMHRLAHPDGENIPSLTFLAISLRIAFY
jgi:isopentenyl diphosphate isomerase/L-lactate dehydrogenase-like FMN-dependent dehydrogenase